MYVDIVIYGCNFIFNFRINLSIERDAFVVQIECKKQVMTYIAIIESYSLKRGYFVKEYETQQEANSFLERFEEFQKYEFNFDSIPPKMIESCIPYDIIGEDYFAGDTENYMDRNSTTDGQLTLQVVRCKLQFDFDQFVKERNGPIILS